MKILKQSVGIDVSKSDFKVCLGKLDEQLSVAFSFQKAYDNNLKGVTLFLKEVSHLFTAEVTVQFILEASGVYHELLAHKIYQHGYEVSIILPSKSKAFFKSITQKVKTDKVDARLLSQLALERQLDNWVPADPIYTQMRSLTRERESLIKEKTVIINKIHAQQSAYQIAKSTLRRSKQRLKLLQKQITSIDLELKTLVESSEMLCSKVNRITKVKGLSLLTVATVIAETNGFAIIRNRRQLVGYAGLDVIINQSGQKSSKGRLSKKGNPHIRKALFMPALSSSRSNELMKIIYQQLNQRQAAKKQGVMVVAKKLLLLIYALWKNSTEYDPQKNIQSRLLLATV